MIDELIDFNGMSIYLGLFYAERSGIHFSVIPKTNI